MPVIKTDTLRFESKDFKRVIRVGSTGNFSCEVPAAVTNTLGIKAVTGATLEQCMSEFNAALIRYKESRTEVRKVIIYAVKSRACIWDNREERVIFRSDEIHFSDGLCLSVCVGVFNERKISATDGSAHYAYDLLECDLPRSICEYSNVLTSCLQGQQATKIIDWTPEREEFFNRIGKGLEAAVLQLSQLSNPATVLQLADSGVLALPAPTK